MSNNVKLKVSFALDVITLIDTLSGDYNNIFFPREMVKEYQKIRKLLKKDLEPISIDCKTLSKILTYYLNENQLSTYNLDDLINVFENSSQMMEIVNKKVENLMEEKREFDCYSSILKNGFEESIINNLKALKKIDFENYYLKNIQPLIEENINNYNNAIQKEKISATFKMIENIKNVSFVDDFTFYITFFATAQKISFLNKIFIINSFESINDNYLVQIIVYDCLNNFLSSKVIKLYQNYVKEIPYLKECYNEMISKKYYVCKEDELNQAIQYYAIEKLCNINHNEIINTLKILFMKKNPVAMLIFEKLCKEGLNCSYEKYLQELFTNNLLPSNNIEEFMNNL